MAVKKLFVLGLPGSGKSSLVRCITDYAKKRCISAIAANDYDILYQMFLEDCRGRFRSTVYGGFDVLDLSVFDIALNILEQNIKVLMSKIQAEEIVIIEFSRNNYVRAFQQFSKEFLEDAFFLYLGVNIANCKNRIRDRITHPTCINDHFVSEYIFENYYCGDDGLRLTDILEKNHRIEKDRVIVMNNDCSLDIASREINKLVDLIFPFSAQDDITDVLLSDSEDFHLESEETLLHGYSEQDKSVYESSKQILVSVGSMAAKV